MDNKRKNKHLFLKGMIIYVLVFAVIAGAALAVLYKYMEAYEVSGSKGFMRGYMENLSEGLLPAACERELEKLDLSIKGEKESRQWIGDMLKEAGYAKVPGASTEDRESYYIISRGVEIGRITIEPSGMDKFGLEMWQISDTSYDLSQFMNTVSYDLPEDYTVQVGEAVIKASKETSEYDALGYVYERYDDMPLLHKFTSGKYLGEAEVLIKDGKGNTVSADKLSEEYFLNNCDAQLHKELKEFGENFINCYVDYGAVNGGNFFYNFSRLKDNMVHGGELYNRVESGWGGIFYSTTEYCKILSLDVNICSELDEDLYIVDVSYTTETKGFADAVVSDNFARIVVVRDDSGKLLAANMYNY